MVYFNLISKSKLRRGHPIELRILIRMIPFKGYTQEKTLFLEMFNLTREPLSK